MIPVYINNRNLLTSTRAMVDYLMGVPEAAPLIVDNASTYPPLLEWYNDGCPVPVVRSDKNGGPRGWQQSVLREHPYYVVTDPDLDLSGVPADVLDLLRGALEAHPEIIKAGLSLETEGLPEDALAWSVERKYWASRYPSDERFWQADIDTTFAMYRTDPVWAGQYGPSLRADRPYTARHLPWYWTRENIGEEERFYLKHATSGGCFYSPQLRDILLPEAIE